MSKDIKQVQVDNLGRPIVEEKTKKGMGIKASRRASNTVVYIILVIMTVVWLFPFIGIVFDSFRVESGAQVDYFFPKEWGLDNYKALFTENHNNPMIDWIVTGSGENRQVLLRAPAFVAWFCNTLFMGICCSVIQTVMVLSVSYALSRMRFKGRKALMNFMLILGMFPGFLTMILLYKVFVDLGLTMSKAPIGLIIVYCASSGMGYYISKGFFDTIPKSLDEAARVDGATRFQVFYKVIMPLAKPIVIYTMLMGFMGPWGDFMFASYIIHENSAGMNVAVGMFEWMSKTKLNETYTQFCAGGVVVAIPVLAVFLSLQKYYVEGVTGGAVKG